MVTDLAQCTCTVHAVESKHKSMQELSVIILNDEHFMKQHSNWELALRWTDRRIGDFLTKVGVHLLNFQYCDHRLHT